MSFETTLIMWITLKEIIQKSEICCWHNIAHMLLFKSCHLKQQTKQASHLEKEIKKSEKILLTQYTPHVKILKSSKRRQHHVSTSPDLENKSKKF